MRNASFVQPYFLLIIYQLILISSTAQDFNPLELNTAADGANSIFPIGAIDPNWSVAFGDDNGPMSDFIPATVVGNCAPGFWFDSPFSNANWISYDFDNPNTGACDHSVQGCLDLFFRREIVLPSGECGTPAPGFFCLGLDFFADNSVHSISVNDIEQYVDILTDDPYNYNGFQIPTSVNLCDGWQSGSNVLLIHIKSCPSSQGFLAQVSSEFDNEYFANIRLDISICSGQEYLGHDQSGVYYDILAGALGCDTIRELHLTIEPAPVTPAEIILCKGATVMVNDLLISSAGVYFDTLSSPNGCDSILLFEVTIPDHRFLGEDKFVCDGQPITIESPSQTTEWSTGEQSQSIRVEEPGQYWASIEDVNGCTLVDTITIAFGPRISAPNIFSPNYDGINDEFQAYLPATIFDHYTLKIFDRWGGLKFQSNNQDVKWDGRHNGELCTEGVYVYVITYSLPGCEMVLLTGDVMLLR